jgi:peptidoglycan/LPS O-acetylase OafA/YrhL
MPGGRGGSFDAVRLLAAATVLGFHLHGVLDGPALRVPGMPALDLGTAAVVVFFGLSGHLVARSWWRDPRPWRFARARALRIYPGLLVCLLVCVAAGAAVTTLPAADFLASWATVQFVLGNATLFVSDTQVDLPGAFHDVRWPVVNTPVYTLRYELLLYVALPVLALARRALPLVVALGAVALVEAAPLAEQRDFLTFSAELAALFGLAFVLGTATAARERAVWRDPLALGTAAAALVLALLAPARSPAELLGATTALALGGVALGSSPLLERALPRRIGDLSYGVYLYGFLVQQVVLVVWEDGPDLAVAAVVVALTLVAAACSWRFVERPALELKRRLDAGRAPLGSPSAWQTDPRLPSSTP